MQVANPADRDPLRKALAHWREDSGLREEEALDRLPPEERKECRTVWSDLEACLTGATVSTTNP
jgi:hypothetical protein